MRLQWLVSIPIPALDMFSSFSDCRRTCKSGTTLRRIHHRCSQLPTITNSNRPVHWKKIRRRLVTTREVEVVATLVELYQVPLLAAHGAAPQDRRTSRSRP